MSSITARAEASGRQIGEVGRPTPAPVATATGSHDGDDPATRDAAWWRKKILLAAALKIARGDKQISEVADACRVSRKDFRQMESLDWGAMPSIALILRVAEFSGTKMPFDVHTLQ